MLYQGFYKLHRLVWLGLAPLAIFSVFHLIISSLISNIAISYITSASLAISILWLSRLFVKERILNQITYLSPYIIVAIGLLIKIVIFLFFPIHFVSDAATYVQLANKLINGHAYGISNTRAYWPPGYPLLLYMTHLGTFNVTTTTVFIQNCVIMLLASYLIYQLALKVANQTAANISLLIFTFWPTGLFGAPNAYKEFILLTLILLSVYIYCVKSHIFWAYAIGLILGICALIQPGSMLFISVFIVINWAKKEKVVRQAGLLVLMVAGMASVISPWSYRNLQVFDKFVLITTNGGSNMYRANNELATGGYIEKGKVDISHLSELNQDKKGKALAIEWITNNKADFLSLSFVKLTRFLGDDSDGVYTTLKRSALGPVNAIGYYALKLVSNVYWMVLWVLVFLNKKTLFQLLRSNKAIAVISLSFLYFLTVHAVFESNSKYHIPVFPMIVLLVAVIIRESDS